MQPIPPPISPPTLKKKLDFLEVVEMRNSPLCDLYLASVSSADTTVRAAAAALPLLLGGHRGVAKQAVPKGGGCELEKSTGSVCSRPVS